MRDAALVLLSLTIATATASAGEIKDIQWRIGPNLPEFRKGGCLCVLDGKVISVFGMRQPWGEMDTMYVYDPATDWWSRGANGPVGQCYVQGTVCGDAFYAIGGRKGQVRKECYRLKVKDGAYSWSQIASLNDARGWAPSVAVGDGLYVFGGAKGGHGPTMSSVERLDTAKPGAAWETITEIPGDSRGWLGAATVGGKVYLIGGYHFFDEKLPDGTDRKRFAEVLEFDPATKQWATRTPLPYRLSGLDCVAYGGRYIIVVGGAADVDDFTEEMREAYEKTDRYEAYYCPFVMVYDVREDSWRRLPTPLPVPANDIRVVRIDKTLYVLGGENVEYATSNTTPWLRIGEIVE